VGDDEPQNVSVGCIAAGKGAGSMMKGDGVVIPTYGFEWSTYHPCTVPSFKYAYIIGTALAPAGLDATVRSMSSARRTVSC
jgi:hypothetical protein